MTEMLNETDVDWLTLIDFESDTSCQSGKCSNEAKWVAKVICCNESILMCDEHRRRWIHFMNAVFPGYQLKCSSCHTVLGFPENSKWIRFIAL